MTTSPNSLPPAAGAPNGEAAAHTPTPWNSQETDMGFAVVSPAQWIATCERQRGNDKANAAFIVRCVNSHAALVEALSFLLRAMDEMAEQQIAPKDHSEWLSVQSARAALKSATT